MNNQELHEITAMSDHTRCFSKTIYDLTDDQVGCTCKTDTVETQIVGTTARRNWQFPKGRFPFVIGQQVTLEEMNTARAKGAIRVIEEKMEARKAKANPAPQQGQH